MAHDHEVECSQLSAAHLLQAFDCGNESLNTWLRQHALSMHTRGHSRVFVWTSPKSPHPQNVVAFFALSAMSAQRSSVPKGFQRGELRDVPAILLGKLALDTHLQGQGLARRLVADASLVALQVAHKIGARFIVVDPIDDQAEEMYAHLGFRKGENMRMYMPLAALAIDLEAALGEPRS